MKNTALAGLLISFLLLDWMAQGGGETAITKAGDPAVSLKWGLDHYYGRNGQKQNKEYGEGVLMRLAESKYEPAENALVNIYAEERNDEKLNKTWENYCKRKLRDGQVEYAFGLAMYISISEKAPKEDREKAWYLCEEMAKKNYEPALIFVGSTYANPKLIETNGLNGIVLADPEKAKQYAQRVIKTNPSEGNYILGTVAIFQDRFSEAYAFLERAALCGNLRAAKHIIQLIEGRLGIVNSKSRELYFRYLANGLDDNQDIKWARKNRLKINVLEQQITETDVEKIKNEVNGTLDQIIDAQMESSETSKTQAPTSNLISFGTGFICSPEGHVLTAAHVVEQADEPKIVFENKAYDAQILSIDRNNDVALLKIREDGTYPFLRFSDKKPEQGGRVSTYGFPNPDIEGFNDIKYSSGEISSLRGLGNDTTLMRLNLQVAPGNSGGPLLDHDNKVIGIVIQKMNSLEMLERTGDLTTGVSYAVKKEYVLPLLQEHKPGNNDMKKETAKKVSDAVVLIQSK